MKIKLIKQYYNRIKELEQKCGEYHDLVEDRTLECLKLTEENEKFRIDLVSEQKLNNQLILDKHKLHIEINMMEYQKAELINFLTSISDVYAAGKLKVDIGIFLNKLQKKGEINAGFKTCL